MTYGNGTRVALVGGVRTPFAKAGTILKSLSAIDLGRLCVAELVQRTDLDTDELDTLVFGTVVPSVVAPNIAREVARALRRLAVWQSSQRLEAGGWPALLPVAWMPSWQRTQSDSSPKCSKTASCQATAVWQSSQRFELGTWFTGLPGASELAPP